MSTEAFVYDAIRTPRGRGKRGSLHGTKPISLVVGLIDELTKRNPAMDTDRIDDLVLGVVSPVADQGADIAKTAALAAHLPDTVAACSSTASAPPAWRRSTWRRRRSGPAGTAW